MPIAKNPNQEFIALPREKGTNVLAEIPCAMCEELAGLKVRKDGWIEIRCHNVVGCGYTESATSQSSFEGLMRSVMDNNETSFRRCNHDDVRAALGFKDEQDKLGPEIIPEPEIEPDNSIEELESFEDFSGEDDLHEALYGE